MKLPKLIEDAVPITDEKLKELDDWYSEFTSNSFEMKFCDADYWAMRKRLLIVEEQNRELREQNRELRERLSIPFIR